MADHPCLTFSRAPLLTLDDATTFSGAPVPPLRDPRTGRVSAAAAELRSAASDRPEDDLPGMLPYQFPTRSSGSFLSGLFGSHYIAHGGPSSGICVGTAELYRAVLSGIMIVDRLNSLPPSRNGGTLNVELGGHLLWMLARLQAIPAAAKTELHGAGLLWASSGFADYLCALWCVAPFPALRCYSLVLDADLLTRLHAGTTFMPMPRPTAATLWPTVLLYSAAPRRSRVSSAFRRPSPPTRPRRRPGLPIRCCVCFTRPTPTLRGRLCRWFLALPI